MKFILKKMKKKKIEKQHLFAVFLIKIKRKIIVVEGKLKGNISTKIIGKKDLDMILFLFRLKKKLHLVKCLS